MKTSRDARRALRRITALAGGVATGCVVGIAWLTSTIPYASAAQQTSSPATTPTATPTVATTSAAAPTSGTSSASQAAVPTATAVPIVQPTAFPVERTQQNRDASTGGSSHG